MKPLEVLALVAGSLAGGVLVSRVVGAASGPAARDMTPEQARAELVDLVHARELELVEALPSDLTARIVVSSTIAGVRYAVGRPGTPIGPDVAIDNLDPRLAIALHRLALRMSRQWGARAIRHLGITHGNGPPTDAHNQGRAIDVAGLEGRFGVDVWRDWGSKPAPYPTGSHATRYRLDRSTWPAKIFLDVYEFAARECTDTDPRAGRNGPRTTIGPSSRYIVHPDHHVPELRAHHQDHVHMQIGPTLGEGT